MIAERGRSSASRPCRVALVIEVRSAFGRGLLRGVHDSMATGRHRWDIWLPDVQSARVSAKELARWSGDGVIAHTSHQAVATAITRTGRPVVDVGGFGLIPDAPTVGFDPAAIARLAADHFATLTLGHVAFVGFGAAPESSSLQQVFAAATRRLGRSVEPFVLGPADRRRAGPRARQRLHDWLVRLPKPVGVLACDDGLGRLVIATSIAAGMRVPEDVAVLGVHDDDLVVPGQPGLSSIVTDARAAGRAAAETLARLLAGHAVAATRVLPPQGIVVRQSTDVVAAQDPVVAAAARFIREHAHRGIRVGDVVASASLGRRALTQRFLHAVGRTPHEEIRRHQLQRVETLLRDTDLTLVTIAGRCGFKHPEYMTAVFTRCYGVPPRDWRRAVRTGSPPPSPGMIDGVGTEVGKPSGKRDLGCRILRMD